MSISGIGEVGYPAARYETWRAPYLDWRKSIVLNKKGVYFYEY